MNDNSRAEELLSLSSSLDEAAASKIVELEGAMAHNKDLVVELNDNGVIEDDEIAEKIERCFQSFLTDVVRLVGQDICREIYGYLPGENLGFIGEFRPGDGVDEFDAAIQDLLEALGEVEGTRSSQILQASADLDLASKSIMSRIDAERQKLGEIASMLTTEADKITGIIPLVRITSASHELSEAISHVAADIDGISHRFLAASDE